MYFYRQRVWTLQPTGVIVVGGLAGLLAQIHVDLARNKDRELAVLFPLLPVRHQVHVLWISSQELKPRHAKEM